MPMNGCFDLNIKIAVAGATKAKAALRRMCVSASGCRAPGCGGWELGALPRSEKLKGQARPLGQRLLTADTRITKVIRTYLLGGSRTRVDLEPRAANKTPQHDADACVFAPGWA